MGMKNLAIITARGGSKRIPKKNIKNFFNKPIIAYAIEACLSSNIFKEVMVSTEDKEIAEISSKYMAKVPFMRSGKTSNDFTSTYDVLEEVVLEYKKLDKEFDNVCCVYPCVPFLTGKILKKAYDKFIRYKANALIPVVKFSYPIQRSLRIENNILKYVYPEFEKSRSQDLEPMFHDVGMFYFIKTKTLLSEKTLVCKNSTYFKMKVTQIQDIDSIEDWEMAELKYKIINKIKAKNDG